MQKPKAAKPSRSTKRELWLRDMAELRKEREAQSAERIAFENEMRTSYAAEREANRKAYLERKNASRFVATSEGGPPLTGRIRLWCNMHGSTQNRENAEIGEMVMNYAECRVKYGGRYRTDCLIRKGELHKVAMGLYSDKPRWSDVEVALARHPRAVVTLNSLTVQTMRPIIRLSRHSPSGVSRQFHLPTARKPKSLNRPRVPCEAVGADRFRFIPFTSVGSVVEDIPAAARARILAEI